MNALLYKMLNLLVMDIPTVKVNWFLNSDKLRHSTLVHSTYFKIHFCQRKSTNRKYTGFTKINEPSI